MKDFRTFGCKPDGDAADEAKITFRENYLSRLLPVLLSIHEQGSGLAIYDRLRAVKFAADMSLVMTVDGVSWSRALGRQLSQQLEGDQNHVYNTFFVSDQAWDAPFQAAGTRNQSQADQEATRRSNTRTRMARSNQGIPQLISNMARRTPSSASNPHREAPRSTQQLLVPRFRKRRPCIKRHRKLTWKRAYRKALQFERERRSTLQMLDESGSSKIRTLRKIVPGGHEMDAPILLEEAADYILSLQMQVDALKSLTGAG